MRRQLTSGHLSSAVAIAVLSTLIGCAKGDVPERRTDSSNSASNSRGSKNSQRDAGTQTAATAPSNDVNALLPEKPREKPTRRRIYDTQTNGRDLIANAVRRAQRDHKQVLVEWGGNWCHWCLLLHDTFKQAPGVREIVTEEFELVLIDSNTNHKLLVEYGGNQARFSFPHLTILDSNGKVLTNQNTEPLEEGDGHSPKAVSDFLKQWVLPKIDAEQMVAEQLHKAKAANKRILLRVGNPYCGWCTVLSQFLQDHEPVFARDYVDVKIDTLRMTNGEAVAEAHRPQDCQGIPWFVILDASGSVLQTSVGGNGNIGYPHEPAEVAHFVRMIRETRMTITDEELATIESDLHDYRIKREQMRAEQEI